MLILTFLVFSDSRSSVLSTNFLKDGLFKGSWFQQDCIMLYLQKKDWDEFQLLKKTLLYFFITHILRLFKYDKNNFN